MKKMCFLLVLLFIAALPGLPAAAAETADFVMTDSKLNIKAAEILTLENAFTYDAQAYTRGQIVIDSNKSADSSVDGQIFLHSGKGDAFTFTVDFGSYQVNKLQYAGYGLSSETKFDIYADSVKLGTGVVNGGNGWLDGDSLNWQWGVIEFPAALSGVCKMKIQVTESAPQWPGNAYGAFTFIAKADETPDFTLDRDEYNIKASDLLALPGCFSSETTEFDRQGHGVAASGSDTMPETLRGQMLMNSGKGDRYTFTADFGTEGFASMGFYSYGLAEDSVIALYADGEYVGDAAVIGGNGWADDDFDIWNYNEITFKNVLTGIHEMALVVSESPAAWPANVFGNFLFYMKTESTAAPAPTDGGSTAAATATPLPSASAAATAKPAGVSPSVTPPDSGDNSDGSMMFWIIAASIACAACVIAGVLLILRRRKHA